MYVTIGEYTIPMVVEKKNNKNIYFRIKDGSLYVTCNKLTTSNYIVKLIKENEKAILKMYNKSTEETQNNNFFNYLGEQYTICYSDNVKEVYFDNDLVFAKDKKMLDKYYLKQVENLFTKEVEKCKLMFDDIPEFKLRFRCMKTRWGVNNVTDRIITLNTELLKKEISLLDYVIIHEICHFYEANHSSRFWNQVEKRYPYYKLARKKLRGEV